MAGTFDTGMGAGSSLDSVLKAIRSVTQNPAFSAPQGRGLTGESSWLESRGGRPGDYGNVLQKSVAKTNANAPTPIYRQATQKDLGTGGGSHSGDYQSAQGRAAAENRAATTGKTNTTGTPSAGSAGTRNKDTTGFGKTIPEKSLNEAWQDPEALINAWQQFANRPTDTPGAAMDQEYADNISLLWMLINNFGIDDKVGLQDYANWSGQFMNDIQTPGQKTANPGQLWDTILNPGEDSILFQNMYGPGLKAGDQVDSFLRTARYGLEQYTPALMLDAQLNYANKLGTDYRAKTLTGDVDQGFNKYLEEQGFMR